MKIRNLPHTVLFGLVLMLGSIVAVFALSGTDLMPATKSTSVEVGLAELSPGGEASGYAVPASGSSCGGSLVCNDDGTPAPAPTCTLSISPATITQGGASQVAWNWFLGDTMTIQRLNLQTGAIEQVLQTSIHRPTITRRVCLGFWNWPCWDHSEPATSGSSAAYDAKTTTLQGGQYSYRGIITGYTGAGVCYVNQTVIATQPNLQGTIGNLGTVIVGQSYPLTYGARNVGGSNAASNTYLELRFDYKRDGWDGNGVDGDFVGGAVVHPLAANGGSQNFTTNVAYPYIGNWRVQTYADASSVVAESNEGDNASAWDDFVVTPPPVSASIDARSPSAGVEWSGSNFSIIAGHAVEVRWSSSGAASCSGSNFTTGGATQHTGIVADTQPAGGQSTTYRISCRHASGYTATDQVTVSAQSVAPTLTASKTIVRTNEPLTLTWNLNGNNPALCTLTGPGSSYAAAGSIASQTGNTEITAIGSATYTLDCPGGEDTVDITVLPQIFET